MVTACPLLTNPKTTDRLSKTWSQRLWINGQPVNVGLGAYPVGTLAEAGKKALKNRRRWPGRYPRFASSAVENAPGTENISDNSPDRIMPGPASKTGGGWLFSAGHADGPRDSLRR